MNSSDSILIGIQNMGKKLESSKIIRKFGGKIIDQEGFTILVRTFNTEISEDAVVKFYETVIKENQASGITAAILDKLLGKNTQLEQAKSHSTPPQEIMSNITKMLKTQGLDVNSVFIQFDQDNDFMLNESEFRKLIEHFIPTLTSAEFADIKVVYPSKLVKPYELVEWLLWQSRNSMSVLKILQRQCISIQYIQYNINAAIIISPFSNL